MDTARDLVRREGTLTIAQAQDPCALSYYMLKAWASAMTGQTPSTAQVARDKILAYFHDNNISVFHHPTVHDDR